MPWQGENASPARRLAPPHNLSAPLTALVGRAQEAAAVAALLGRADVRLLTLTGPPGIGKTRLGLQVAARLLADFADGVFFVNLAALTDPNRVITTIVYTLGVRQVADQPLLQCLQHFLAERQLLLVLDNFEQVVAAAPHVTALLLAAPRLKVLVTSRELLHLSGEHNFPVPPLELPPVLTDQGVVRALADLPAERIAAYEAVQLFAQRARALKPDFALTESNALTVAGICSRLDGLPLAIELAAARIQHLPPQALLDRLQNRLRLLTGGTQDLPARQRTLRATIEWSYNLLNEDEQRLFRRLAVFQGGSTLAAIEAVCDAAGDLGVEPLDGVTSLIDKSLLRSEYNGSARGPIPVVESPSHSPAPAEGEREAERAQGERPEPEGVASEPYFAMLETIHEYAGEQLEASRDAAIIRQQHAAYFLMLAQQAEAQLRGPQQAAWLSQIERDRENFRAALDWTYQHDLGRGLQLVAVLGPFWIRRSQLSEGQERVAQMLSQARDAGVPPSEALARALHAAGLVAWHQGDLQAARPFLEESVQIIKDLLAIQDSVDTGIMAESLNILGIIVGRVEGIPARRSLHEEALAVARERGDEWSVARSLYQLGHVGRMSGDYALAQSLFAESLALFRASGDEYNIGLALIGAGLMAQQREDYDNARALFAESLSIFRVLGVSWAVASMLYSLGSVAVDQGDYAGARSFLEESLTLQRELGIQGDTAEGLETLGRAAYFQGDYGAAYSFYRESLTLFQEVGDKYGMALCLMDLAGVMIALGEGRGAALEPRHAGAGTRPARRPRQGEDSSPIIAIRGVHLLGAAQALLDSFGIQLNQMGSKLFDTYVVAAREHLGERPFAAAFAAGQALDVESAIAWALTTPVPQGAGAGAGAGPPPARGSVAGASSPLTRREREIAALLAQGKSNRQIADTLVMSERTVEWHTSNILSKLSLQSRSQVAVWAVEQGLPTPS